jgi:hypothetical protein
MTPIEMGLALIAAHALADYPLQGDFLSKAKNRSAPIPGVPWWQAMSAHAAIHGGAVGLITGYWWLGVAEAAVHFWIDDLKCRGKLSFNQDQFFHIAFKALWLFVALNWGAP